MYEAYEYTAEHGIMLRGQYAHPYSPHVHHCEQTEEFYFKNSGQEEQDMMNNDEIKKKLLEHPVGAAIYSTGYLQHYIKGIVTEDYLHCSKYEYEVNHGIVIVGYGFYDNENITLRSHCDMYWIVRNSWGGRWGENGFFKLCADDPFTDKKPFGTCHINEFGTWPI